MWQKKLGISTAYRRYVVIFVSIPVQTQNKKLKPEVCAWVYKTSFITVKADQSELKPVTGFANTQLVYNTAV